MTTTTVAPGVTREETLHLLYLQGLKENPISVTTYGRGFIEQYDIYNPEAYKKILFCGFTK